MLDIIQEIEEEKQRSSPLVVQDKIDGESQEEIENQPQSEGNQENPQHLHPDTVIKDIEENMKPVLQGMGQVIEIIKDYFSKHMT